ncbi:TIGR03943 family putative permease subunit [Leptolyngbya sp. AN03gr2]|uniref:TIGR03943 family putative permease subunit n=1 Tax=unclassified Leptolyngbya TaxID=2650499 RepID=UPI003D323F61
MNPNRVSKRQQSIKRPIQSSYINDWIEALGIAAWGILVLKLWITGKLSLLVHPRYVVVCLVTAIVLLLLAAFKAWRILYNPPTIKTQHLSTLPPEWTSRVLLVAALLGMLIQPQTLGSQAAMQQGLPDSLITSTRIKPQAFRASVRSEDKSLVDWARTLAVYPEPDSYLGQKVKLQGFALHSPNLSDQYFVISRFVIAHCALDAYPVGIPVKLTQSRQAYPVDTWWEVEGQMIVETVANERQLVIQANSLKSIPEPKEPYEY